MRTFQEYLDKKRHEINSHIKLIVEDKISDPDVILTLLNLTFRISHHTSTDNLYINAHNHYNSKLYIL